MTSQQLYTAEDALMRFEKVKEKIEKELEIEAVQKRVVAKITNSKCRIFDLNFFQQEDENEEEYSMEECIEEASVQSVEEEESKEEEKSILKPKKGYIDDMAEASSDYHHEVEEDDESGNIEDFIASSGTVDENVIRLDGEEAKAEDIEEMRKLRRKLCTKRIISKPDTGQMVFEDSLSDENAEIKELDINEFETVAIEAENQKTDRKEIAREKMVLQRLEYTDDGMFEDNEEALRRLKRGKAKNNEMPMPQNNE